MSRHVRRPKLGQHFLVDARYRQRIAAVADLRPEDLVVEIGPGPGAITELLAERARYVVAVELDSVLAEQLRKKLGTGLSIEVLQADFLTLDLADLCRRKGTERCFVFGNLPYYITSPIIHRLFLFHDRIRAMALLVQHEVAERLVAGPGTREYGYLTVLTQFFSSPRILLSVPPGAFVPCPLLTGRVWVPMPIWTKVALDEWIAIAGISAGTVFRSLDKSGRVNDRTISTRTIFDVVKRSGEEIGVSNLAPHDLRRTFAKLATKEIPLWSRSS